MTSGNIADSSGNIWLHSGVHGEGSKLKCGVVLLTVEQASAAMAYGWELVPRHDAADLKAVMRHPAKADEMRRKAWYEATRL